MLKFVHGDMFDDAYDIRVNTVNCVGVMGAGVALAFKSRYPDMFRAYKKACDDGRIKPGEIDVWRTLTEWIINFPTKVHWRNKSRYEDIDAGLSSLREYLKAQGAVRVALPALGCGHGGLDWDRVAPMIEAKLKDLDAEVHVFEPADSRAAGEKAGEAERRRAAAAGLEWCDLDAADPSFPARMRAAGVERLTVIGSATLLADDAVAVLGSVKPDAREEASAMACVEALASAGVTQTFSFGNRVSHALAAACRERGGNVILWAAQGGSHIQVPAKFHEDVRRGCLAVVTVAAPGEHWTRLCAERTALLQSSVASAVLLTGHRPDWPPTWWGSRVSENPVFCIWYGEAEQAALGELRAVDARRIGRDRRTGKPSVAPILEALASRRGATDGHSTAHADPPMPQRNP